MEHGRDWEDGTKGGEDRVERPLVLGAEDIASAREMKPYDHAPLVTNSQPRAQSPVYETSPRPTPKRRGPSACSIFAASFGLLALACALLAFATVQGGFEGLRKLTGIIPNISIVTTPTVTIDTTRPSVISQIKRLSQLTTVRYQLEKVVTGESSGPLPDFLTSDKILLIAHGEVAGGVDLAKVKESDVVMVSDTIRIRMPKAEIVYSKLDNDKTHVYDRQTGIFSKPDPNLESQMRQAAEKAIVDAAREDGILLQAGQNAEQVVRGFLLATGYKSVEFEGSP